MEFNVVYNEDCIEGMRRMSDECIDLVVTDCPYKIVSGGCINHRNGFVVCGGIDRRGNSENHNNAKSGKLFTHNDVIFSDWLPDLYRILKFGGHCYIMVNSRNLKDLQIEAERCGFIFQQLLIWDKGNSTPNRWYMGSFECILMFRKGKAIPIHHKGSSNLIRIPNKVGSKLHPTEKPIELMSYLIRNSSSEGDIVLDPFAGSGSTLLSCRRLNRRFIGFEIDKKYYAVIQDRLRELELWK